jgi:hypothetical protein
MIFVLHNKKLLDFRAHDLRNRDYNKRVNSVCLSCLLKSSNTYIIIYCIF